MKLHLVDETAPLEAVVLGIGTDRGKPRLINPTMRHHYEQHTYPTDQAVQRELAGFARLLEAEGVEVLRPDNIPETEQIFARDIGFVIGKRLFIANMKKPVRRGEIEGLTHLLAQLTDDQVVELPEGAFMEGGDVLLLGDYILVGVGDRTNRAGVEFLRETFPEKTVVDLDLVVTQDHRTNILHLDCAFQPLGGGHALFYEAGFRERPEIIHDLFPEDKLIRVNQEQMNRMFPNVFSVAPDRVVVEAGFTALIEQLQARNYTVLEVEFAEVSKLGGLLRCSTLPLRRKV